MLPYCAQVSILHSPQQFVAHDGHSPNKSEVYSNLSAVDVHCRDDLVSIRYRWTVHASNTVRCSAHAQPHAGWQRNREFENLSTVILVQCHAFWASGSDPTGCGQKATCPAVCFKKRLATVRVFYDSGPNTALNKLLTGGQHGRSIAYDSP